jgi:hypothetical protein
MATNRPLSHHHYYYQITHPVLDSKFRSKSSDSLINLNLKNESPQKQSKMKTSQTAFPGFEIKPIQTTFNSAMALRRRFSFFRRKRSQPSNEHSHVQVLQQIIEQLRHDLQTKTDELETMKEHIENKRTTSMIQPANESIEQAMQLQTMLNARLEEMLIENDQLKKSIQELESFAQQEKSKRKKKKSSILSMINVCSYPLVIVISGIAQ